MLWANSWAPAGRRLNFCEQKLKYGCNKVFCTSKFAMAEQKFKYIEHLPILVINLFMWLQGFPNEKYHYLPNTGHMSEIKYFDLK